MRALIYFGFQKLIINIRKQEYQTLITKDDAPAILFLFGFVEWGADGTVRFREKVEKKGLQVINILY